MSMRAWIRNLFTRTAVRTIRKAPRRPRLTLEVLEDRCVPATFTVLNNLDDGSVGSLRWAVCQANTNAGPDTINFGDGSASDGTNFLDGTQQTITLADDQLTLTGSATTTITGPGADLLSISGNFASRVFNVDFGTSAALTGLTITEGREGGSDGGGLVDNGMLTLTNVNFRGNSVGSDNTSNSGGA